MSEFAIRTDGLTWRTGQGFTLDQVDLRVPTGAVYGFLGPNGAGKTSTIRALLGLLGKVDGKVTVLGHDIPRELPRALARTGYVPERPHLYQHLTVAQALAYHAAFHAGWDAAFAESQRVRFALAADREIAQLSKGEIGKLMILLALAQRPELLLLDEPTDGLDPVVRRDVLSALVEYVDERKATVFISSHLVHELERICDWVGLMDSGRLVAEMPMGRFKAGVRRLRLAGTPPSPDGAPFTLLARETPVGRGEEWLVRDWTDGMEQWFATQGADLREVGALDLEDVFVELLRWARFDRRTA
jgi:ABC-2 type transport system ATP-binding protein